MNNHIKPGCTITGTIFGRPEKREELIALMRSFVAPTRSEAGCVEYHFHESHDEPNTFMFYENWVSQEALDLHLGMPYIRPIFERHDELLAAPPVLRHYTHLAPYQAVGGVRDE